MSALDRLTSWSEQATLKFARTSQAAVLGLADYGQRHWPRAAHTLVSSSLRASRWLVDEPGHVLARRYAFLEDLVELHGEFAQRLLEIVESSTDDGEGDPD